MKTFEELGITLAEYDALKVVRANLASGQFIHLTQDDFETIQSKSLASPVFNMEVPAENYDCGSVACIGGWTKAVMDGGELTNEYFARFDVKTAADEYVRIYRSESLDPLFYPNRNDGWIIKYDEITIPMAVEAIDNFLESGDPKWTEVTTSLFEDDED
jgi:hypothetical protein